MSRSATAERSSGEGAYERAVASLSSELAALGLVGMDVWRCADGAPCNSDRASGSPAGRVLATGQAQLHGNTVTAPIAFEERPLGTLSARFSTALQAAAATARVEAAAAQLAALLEVERLARRNAAVSCDWEVVVSALQAIAGGTDLHAICDAVRRHLARTIDFDCMTVARAVAESEELEAFYLYESGFSREVSMRLPLGRTIQEPAAAATTSAIFAPMRAGAALLGVLSLKAERPGAFGHREHALLEPIAEGLALAMARSHLQHVSEDARIERGVMIDMARALAQDIHPTRIFEEVCRQTRLLVDSPDIYIALARDGAPLQMAHHFHDGAAVQLEAKDVPSPRMLEVAREGTPLICNTRAEMLASGVPPDLRPDLNAVAIVPLRAGDAIVGVLHCGSPREHAYPASRADLLISIGEQAGIAINNARMFEAAADHPNRDPLTELLNHRAVMVGLERLLVERNSGVAIVLLDVESFRLFNTTFGHHVGDEALRLVACCIRRAIGDGALLARYGGDEFLIVLPEGGAAAAGVFLEGLRAALAASPLDSPSGAPIPISCSAGIAAAPADGMTREALVAAADERLQAERSGSHACISYASGRAHPLLSDAQEGLLVAILRKDLYTRAHIHFVGETALDFAEALGLDAEMTRALFLGSLLHDVGKICIPDAIISKPSTLTSAERKTMQRHTMLGYELVRGVDGMDIASLAVLHHHERMDGRGYPYGLAGEAIPSIARMVTIIDAFSAMVLDRPYHKAITDDAAKAELRRCAGRQFDANYVSVFCGLFDPTGT